LICLFEEAGNDAFTHQFFILHGDKPRIIRVNGIIRGIRVIRVIRVIRGYSDYYGYSGYSGY
jgi:hypothetical protein